MQASFLDPRFQNLQSADDVAVIKCALKKLNDMDPDIPDPLSVKKEKVHALPSALNKQKSGKRHIFHKLMMVDDRKLKLITSSAFFQLV